jgi:nucleoid-associated protein Lsr2
MIIYTDGQANIKFQIGARPMAQRTQVLYVDDIDGSEAEGTVRFGLGGTDYEIDLNKKHADQFAKAIGPYVEAARKVPSSRRSGRGPRSPRHDQSDVRAWAREQGIKVSTRGRIPADVLARYRAAH